MLEATYLCSLIPCLQLHVRFHSNYFFKNIPCFSDNKTLKIRPSVNFHNDFNIRPTLKISPSYKTVNKKIEVRLNRIIRIATFISIYTPINTMYKELNILNISDIYHLEFGKFMYQLYSDRLPVVLAQLFKKIKVIHSHNTRQTEKSTYFLPRVYKTIGQQLLTFRGAKLWYSIDDTIKDRRWVFFKKTYKQHLVDQY